MAMLILVLQFTQTLRGKYRETRRYNSNPYVCCEGAQQAGNYLYLGNRTTAMKMSPDHILPSFVPAPDKRLRRLPLVIIAAGILLRLVLFFQDRNLIIDEANVARNLYERDYLSLLRPLAYQQFAPPGFLWAEKWMTQLFGYGEKALRLLPLLCGTAALFAFHRFLRRLLPLRSYWFPLAVFSVGSIYVEYSTVVKQYTPDVLITLLLVMQSASLLGKNTSRKALAIQALCGALAIWCSMPVAFVLGGIGVAQFAAALRRKDKNLLAGTCLAAVLWLFSFAIYYKVLLQYQIGNDVLQAFHEQYFVFLLPRHAAEWSHDLDRLLALAGVAAGYTGIAMGCSVLFFLAGIVQLWRRRKALLVLLLLPAALMWLAAGLHHFTLIERVVLFALPLLLAVMGFGLECLLGLLHRPWLRWVLLAVSVVAVCTYGMFGIVVKKYTFAELTEGMEYVQKQGLHEKLYLHHAVGDAFIYYTTIHPGREQWKMLQQHTVILKWDDDYARILPGSGEKIYYLYNRMPASELDARHGQWSQRWRLLRTFNGTACRVEEWQARE